MNRVEPPPISELSFEAVGIRLGERRVLDEVSFKLSGGEVVGLLGRNGAGKTTLVRAASRNLALSRGRICLEGRSVEEWSQRGLAQRIAVVPQDMNVPFPFTAGEIVLMGRSPYQGLLGFDSDSDLESAIHSMERLGISHLADRPIDRLSGGERQLVLIARALSQSPDWLLLDEPTAFLDLQHRIDVLGVLREFARAGGGVLVVSHDLMLAARICDRLLILSDGTLAAAGPPREVLTPELLWSAFGLRVDVIEGPDGYPVVVPQMESDSSIANAPRALVEDPVQRDC